MDTYLFINNSIQLEYFLSNPLIDIVVVSTAPDISERLKNESVHYIDIFEYAVEDELQQIGLDILTYTEQILKMIGKLCLKDSNQEMSLGYHFFLRILFNNIHSKIYLIKRFIKSCDPSKIIIFDDSQKEEIPWYLVEGNKDYWNPLLKLCSTQLHVPVDSIEIIKERIKKGRSIKSYLKNNLNRINIKKHFYNTKLVRILVVDRMEEFSIIKEQVNGGKIIIDELEIKDEELYHCTDRVITKKIKYQRSITNSFNYNSIYDKFIFEGIDYSPFINPYIERITQALKYMEKELCGYFYNYFKNKKIKAVLRGPLTNPYMGAAIFVAKCMDIPLITFQHGGNYGYVNLPYYKYTDFLWSDYFICWGKAIKENFENDNIVNPKRTTLISLGTPRFLLYDKIEQKINEETRFLYLPVSFMGNYLCYDRHNIPDFICYQTQINIFNWFEAHKIKLIVKPLRSHWSKYLLDDYLAKNKFNYIKILNTTNLQKVFLQINKVLLDWPSTTFIESLYSKKEVFILHNILWSKIHNKALPSIRRSAKIIYALDELLKVSPEGHESVENYTHSFIEDYASSLDEVSYATKILSIIQNKSKK